ncbi:MAG: genetic competence negative regulator [Candidatus Pristimantibacillus lignocellulolyticus]|uniref:Genetic competence negative regulator n=1 Tax=Candidatus Pristimantibacillus lignocellulolyticus TaxID=2994561 RepID=A0A9J6ZDK0_9BACL|nr:MAG: genetic competence negative regulator [Candidatus Pristimantibacillus lignocellulolyticus]
MKIERLGQDKIRIFLTYDDLLERGIQKEDMLREPPKLHDLFMELMEQAYTELGFEASGRPLAVEVYAMPAQGMFVVVTRGKRGGESVNGFSEDDDLDDDIYDLDVTMEHSDIIMYSFNDFEHIISVCKALKASQLTDGGTLFSYNNKWILSIEPSDIESTSFNSVLAILAEYGDATSVTYAMLEEYGKVIMAEEAVHQICTHFQ